MIKNPTKSLAWPFAEKVLRLILGTTLTLLIARQIGPSEFGVYSAIFAIFMLFGALAGLGLKDVVIDEIAKGRTASRIVLTTASTMVFTASLVLSITFVMLIKFVYPSQGTLFLVACFLSTILLLKGLEVLLFGLEAHAELRSISIAQQISLMISATSKVAILLIGFTVVSFAAVTALEYLVLYIAAVLLASQRGLVLSKSDFCIEYAKALLKRSWPLAVSSLAVIGYFYIDQIMIALLIDAESAGIYAAASRISQQLYIIPTVLVAAYYPRLTHIHAQSPAEFNEGFKFLSVVLIALSIIMSGVMLLLSEQLLELVLGDQFKETASILKLHALGLVFVSLNVISGRWYVMQGLQKLTLVRQLLTAILNVVLNLLFIPIFGLEGAVYATLISFLFLAFGFDLIGRRTRTLAKIKIYALAHLIQPQKLHRAFRAIASL